MTARLTALVPSAAAAVPAVLVLLAVLAAGSSSFGRLPRAVLLPGPVQGAGPWARARAWRRRASAPAPPAVVARASAELAALLRAGALPATAWACLADADREAGPVLRGDDPVRAALRAAARAAGSGGDVAAALSAPGTGRSVPHAAGRALAALAAAWRVAERTGAPVADVLDRLAASLRADADAAAAREAALAAPRATARLLVALPPAGLVLGAAIGADPLTVLTTTAPGRVCAVVGVAATAAGAVWTRALVRAASGGRGPRPAAGR